MKQNTLFRPRRYAALGIAAAGLYGLSIVFAYAHAPAEKSIDTPQGLQLSVKMIGPVSQTTDLQIICILKHDPAGDKYIEAMKDLNERLGGLLSSLRDRGEFVGELGETLLFTPPPASITPARLLLIGVGDEPALTLDRMRLVGRIAVREAVRLRAANVSFAPALRDQGSVRIDVAEGDAAFAEQFLLAYNTERRLQAEKLSPAFELKEVTIEAGRKYFDGAAEKVAAAAGSASAQIREGGATPYHNVRSNR